VPVRDLRTPIVKNGYGRTVYAPAPHYKSIGFLTPLTEVVMNVRRNRHGGHEANCEFARKVRIARRHPILLGDFCLRLCVPRLTFGRGLAFSDNFPCACEVKILLAYLC
jgi:hypothetical protein